jgi:hypothetical protein
MVSVMVPPIGTVVAGVNTSTGLAAAPATPPEVMEVKMIPVMATASKATDNPASALDFIWKPPATTARAPPRVSPVSVIVMAAVPVAAPAVVSTIEVLAAVAAGVEVAVKDVTALAMEVTDPKK